MQIGMVGLGRMGAGMTRRLMRDGHEVVVHDVNADAMSALAEEGARPSSSLEDLAARLTPPRAVWLMVPAGEITEQMVGGLRGILSSGDVVIDGGNSRYTDTVRRAEVLAGNGIRLVDAGTSGGIWGLEEGYCLMVGAEDEAFRLLEPAFATLAPENGYARVGPPGAGHFVKMVHNGIEYALMQAYAEGFDIMRASAFELDVGQIANLWRHGSVVRSWLLDLAVSALDKDPDLQEVAPYVEDSGEGRWTVHEAVDRAVPAPTLAGALFARFASRDEDSFGLKLLAALRREFGGHEVRKSER